MTVRQFDHGYWYATEVKRFAKSLGIKNIQELRKDELERAIRHYLAYGTVTPPTTRTLSRLGPRDVDLGLRLNRRVIQYTNDNETKAFIDREALKLDPTFRRRPGSRYRLNRWREVQLTSGVPITYRDLVMEHVRLNRPETKHTRAPSARYINFVSDYVAENPGVPMASAIRAWKAVKRMATTKDYRAFKRVSGGRSRGPSSHSR